MAINNLGNVAGVVAGINPPLEADGVTEKRYVLWAKTVSTIPLKHELHYFDISLNTWTAFTGATILELLTLKQLVFGTINDVEILANLATEGVSSLWELVLSSGGGGGGVKKYTFSFTAALDEDETLGKYHNGDEVEVTAKEVPEIFEQIGRKVLTPELIPPTFTIALSSYTTQEVGSLYTGVMTATLNLGQIKGKIVGSVWEKNTKQADRSGAASTYILDGNTQAGNTRTLSKVLVLGNNLFEGSVNFLTGPQPKNSANLDFDSPYPPGTRTDSKAVSARYKQFHGYRVTSFITSA